MTIPPVPSASVVPSSPVPDTATLVFDVVRAVLQLLGGLGIGIGAFGNLPDSTLMMLSGLVVSAATTVWSQIQQRRAARKDHLGSLASAQLSAKQGFPEAVTPVMKAL